jgi:hypothetical protein
MRAHYEEDNRLTKSRKLESIREMAATGSLAECRLLARNPLKLPGRFQDRGDCPLMAGEGGFLTISFPNLHKPRYGGI